jgi:hypothetical protein
MPVKPVLAFYCGRTQVKCVNTNTVSEEHRCGTCGIAHGKSSLSSLNQLFATMLARSPDARPKVIYPLYVRKISKNICTYMAALVRTCIKKEELLYRVFIVACALDNQPGRGTCHRCHQARSARSALPFLCSTGPCLWKHRYATREVVRVWGSPSLRVRWVTVGWPWRRKPFRESYRFARVQQSGAGAESDIAALTQLSMEIAINEGISKSWPSATAGEDSLDQ